MTVGTGASPNIHTGNGVTTTFAYQFTLLDAADLVVTLDGVVSGAYSLTGLGVAAGGTVIFSTAPANGVEVILRRVMTLDRAGSDYQNNGDFLADTIDNDLDRLWLALQERDSDLGRVLRLPFPEDCDALPVAASRRGKLLGFADDATALPVVVATTTGSAAALALALAASDGASTIGFVQAGVGAVARTVQAKLREVSVSVMDFGADNTGIADSLAAFNAAIAYVEQQRNSGGGGVVYVPAGAYKLTDTLRVGGFVRMVGENYLTTVLFWPAAHASGHCVELGPDESGLYAFSGSYTFASRIENLDLNGQDIDRGATSAMVYTVGAHQFSGLFNVFIRRFRNIGIHYDLGTGDPTTFMLDQVELQGSVTPPGAGSTVGLKCSAGGAIINARTLLVQGDTANPIAQGILMTKDVLSLFAGHFEHCLVGIDLQQNGALTAQNVIASVTGHNSVPVLVQRADANNCEFTLINVTNTTLLATSLNVLADLETGLTVGGTNGRSLPYYSSAENQLHGCVTVEVTSAQLLALNATPKTIIPAPDAGFAAVPTRVAIHKPAGTAYAGIAAGEDLVLKYTNAAGAECSAQIETTGFLDQATAETRFVGMPAAAVEPVAAAAVVLHLLTGEIITGNTSIHVRVWFDLIPTVFTA